MHSLLLTAMLAPGALAGGACIALRPGNEGFAPGNFGNAKGANTVAPVTHTWALPNPSALISSLNSMASATPSAVSILSGVSLQGAGTHAPVPVPTGGPLASSITPPDGCTSIYATVTTPISGAATSTSEAASSGAYTTAAASTGAASSGAASSGAATSGAASSGAASSGVASPTSVTGRNDTLSASRLHSSKLATSTTKASSAHHTTTSVKSSSTSATKTTSKSSAPVHTACTSPTARVEWRNMAPAQQQELVESIKCLMTTPPRSGLPGVKSRWDDLVAIHQMMAPTIHEVGQFLSYHRQFIWVYEQELRNTCNYKGALPWWDETKDAGHFAEAPMMTSTLYGSAPDGPSQCITDGAFAGVTLDIGPGTSDTQHCLARGVNETLSAVITESFVNTCNSYNNFDQMANCQFFGVHGYCHDAVGGVMSDITSSPNDPLFFLHHAFVDRNYRNWQLVDPSSRTYAIGGYTTQNCLNGGSGCVETSLNYVLSTQGFYPDVTVAQASDTQGGHLCYYYDY